ncbi:50S ribosomal protein L16, partial [Candidatus Woesearchaeota archaeon CG11_big_fil_rev_8_21_14_0_20_57_5]
KYKSESFIKASPPSKIIRFDMGNSKKEFPLTLSLVSSSPLQIRHNAIESARQTGNRHLEKFLGKEGFHMKIRIFPHHVLRENPLAAGAGADRMSTGMQKAFGKSISVAAQVHTNQTLITLRIEKNHLAIGKRALQKAASKLPCNCRIVQSGPVTF